MLERCEVYITSGCESSHSRDKGVNGVKESTGYFMLSQDMPQCWALITNICVNRRTDLVTNICVNRNTDLLTNICANRRTGFVTNIYTM
jgi:hypothetical protein